MKLQMMKHPLLPETEATVTYQLCKRLSADTVVMIDGYRLSAKWPITTRLLTEEALLPLRWLAD